MTLIRGANGRGGLSSLAPHTTIYGEESLIENGEIEELHYLSVKVERMKKAMLNRVEGVNQTEIKDKPQVANKSNLIIDENDRREEMLYRSMDNINDIQNGGGDILNSNANGELSKQISTKEAIRRNSELNSYSEIAIKDQNDAYSNRRQGKVTNLDIQAIRNSSR